MAKLKIISPQQARDEGLFGPLYHGTTEENMREILKNGFKIFIGSERSGQISHGYSGDREYSHGTPPPVHHLGYGVYFTTKKSIAKDFGNRAPKHAFYLTAQPHVINFGSPNTMMQWWIKNGYDPKLAKKDRVAATKKLTNELKKKHKAIWFKGQGLRRLLDGDQVVVFDLGIIRGVDPTMSKGMEIGALVEQFQKWTFNGKIPEDRGDQAKWELRPVDPPRKGRIMEIRTIPEQARPFNPPGAEAFVEVKYDQGGKEYNTYMDELRPRKPSRAAKSSFKVESALMEAVRMVTEKKGVVYKHGTVMVDMPKDVAGTIKQWQKQIAKEDIYTSDEDPSLGLEDESHVTVLYGIRNEDLEKAKELISSFGPIELELDGLMVFDNADNDRPYEVLNIRVKGRDIRNLHKLLKENVENKHSWPIYRPHVCIGYLKKGASKKYKALEPPFKNKALVFDSVTISRGAVGEKDNEKETVMLGESSLVEGVAPGTFMQSFPTTDGRFDDAFERAMAFGRRRGIPIFYIAPVDNRSVVTRKKATRLVVGYPLSHVVGELESDKKALVAKVVLKPKYARPSGKREDDDSLPSLRDMLADLEAEDEAGVDLSLDDDGFGPPTITWLRPSGDGKITEAVAGPSPLEEGATRENFDGMIVFHSTDEESAKHIVKNGFEIERSSGGYYGYAVSVTDGLDYSKQFGSWTVVAQIKPGTKILDLSYSPDWEKWLPITNKHMGEWHKIALRKGIQGVCDRGAGDIFLFDPSRLKVLGYFDNQDKDASKRLEEITGKSSSE